MAQQFEDSSGRNHISEWAKNKMEKNRSPEKREDAEIAKEKRTPA